VGELSVPSFLHFFFLSPIIRGEVHGLVSVEGREGAVGARFVSVLGVDLSSRQRSEVLYNEDLACSAGLLAFKFRSFRVFFPFRIFFDFMRFWLLSPARPVSLSGVLGQCDDALTLPLSWRFL